MEENTILEKIIVNKFFKYMKQSSVNNKCADCNGKSPIWASLTYGIYICTQCAAKHREMGVLKSKVKSTLLDRWKLGEIRRMYVSGNKDSYKLGNERDLNIKYSQVEWYSQEVDRKVRESVVEDPNGEFLNKLEDESVNTLENEIIDQPMPTFGDRNICIEETEEPIDITNEPIKKENEPPKKEIFQIKKKNTISITKNKKYNTEDDRLGFNIK